ncbi:MAG: trypsin-like serine protease [Acidobacteria bacterium]|nr:trypsin-like serine protease [Acidobacteriota bacterium]
MQERTRFEHERLNLDVRLPASVPAFEYEAIEGRRRNRVRDSFSIPFRFICHLEISYEKTRTKMGGTGTLIDRRYVLTAAHNLHTTEKLTARRIVVSPARNGGPNSIGGLEVADYFVHRGWKRTNSARDYALIKLKKDVALDNFIETEWKPLGCWGDPKNGGGTSLEPLPANQLDGRTVFVAGYPLEKNDETNFTMSGGMGTLMGVAPNRPVHKDDVFLYYNVSTGKGESGSPVWVRDDKTNTRNLVGIHIGTGREEKGKFVSNRAVRITNQVLAQIDAWMKT